MNQGKWMRTMNGDTAVVFIHGINSSEECWRNKNNGAYWPDLLREENELSSVAIYLFSYQTGFFSGYYNLEDIVDSLKEYLSLDEVINYSKIIFIAFLGLMRYSNSDHQTQT